MRVPGLRCLSYLGVISYRVQGFRDLQFFELQSLGLEAAGLQDFHVEVRCCKDKGPAQTKCAGA